MTEEICDRESSSPGPPEGLLKDDGLRHDVIGQDRGVVPRLVQQPVLLEVLGHLQVEDPLQVLVLCSTSGDKRVFVAGDGDSTDNSVAGFSSTLAPA